MFFHSSGSNDLSSLLASHAKYAPADQLEKWISWVTETFLDVPLTDTTQIHLQDTVIC